MSLKSTSSIIAIDALSPNLLPNLITLVYPPGLSATFFEISSNKILTPSLFLSLLKHFFCCEQNHF